MEHAAEDTDYRTNIGRGTDTDAATIPGAKAMGQNARPQSSALVLAMVVRYDAAGTELDSST